MRYLLVFLSLLFTGCEKPTENLLRFDGFYQSEVLEGNDLQEFSHFHYFRFYEDGTVISVPTTGLPSEIDVWFNLETEEKNFSVGKYKRNQALLEFETTSVSGTVEYSGLINADSIFLESNSLINGHEEKRAYRFVQ